MFYHFNQNNSGGWFAYNSVMGISVHVIIEAPSPEVANSLAENKGIYFNGCDDDTDCSCCGDRWCLTDNYDASEVPSVYGKEVKPGEEMGNDYLSTKWLPAGAPEGFIHYADGTIKSFWAEKPK